MSDVTSNCELNSRDVRDFFVALETYADFREDKSFQYALNRAAKDVAARAAKFTYRASDTALRAMLGQPAVQMAVSKKTGQLRRVKTAARATNDAGAILAARMTRVGKNPRKMYSSTEWNEKIRKFVGRTLSSINFIRSGWLPAFKKLQVLVHQSSGVGVTEAFGRSKEDMRGSYAKHSYPSIGDAVPAREMGETIVVEISNESVNPRNSTSWSKGLGKYGVAGLEQALADKAADMLQYIEDAHNAKLEKSKLG